MLSRPRATNLALALLLLVLTISPGVAAQEGPPTAERVAALNAPATVLLYGTYKAILTYPYAIYNQNKDGTFTFEAHPEKKVITETIDEAWTGSGFIVTPDGYIITNAHVASDKLVKDLYLWNLAYQDTVNLVNAGSITAAQAEQFFIARYMFYVTHGKFAPEQTLIYVLLGTTTFTEDLTAKGILADTKISGEPVGMTFNAMWKDVAIVKISSDYSLPTVQLGDSDKVDTGHSVYVIGYPGMETPTVQNSIFEPTITAGIVSSLKSMPGGWRAIQTDATIHHGNSGGPAFNSKGEVIGLATFGASAGGQELSGINFLVPINVAKEYITQLNLKPRRGEIDQYWEEGLNLYWGNHFSAAVTQFQKVLDLYPGQPYATRYMRQAKDAIAEGRDVPTGLFGINPTYLAIGVAVVVIALVAVLAMSKRKKPTTTIAASQQMMPPTVVSAPTAAGYCSKCGATMANANDRFCPICGAPTT